MRSRGTWKLAITILILMIAATGYVFAQEKTPASASTLTTTVTSVPTFAATPTFTATPTFAATPTPEGGKVVREGIHIVGDDIEPGIYFGVGGIDMWESCYVARLNSPSGNFDEIISADAKGIGLFYVQVLPEDKALINRQSWETYDGDISCQLTRLEEMPPIAELLDLGSLDTYPPGTYLVGRDLEPGLYIGGFTGDCHWTRLRDVTLGEGSAFAKGEEVGEFAIELLPTDFAVHFSCDFQKEGMAKPTPTPTVTGMATATPMGRDGVKLGTHLVGVDIAPGIYTGKVPKDEFACAWERLSNLSGDSDSVFGRGIGFGPGQYYLEVLITDHAVRLECPVVAFTATEATTLPENENLKLGTLFVGKEIVPGLYKGVVPSDENFGCLWERLTNFRGERDSSLGNDIVEAGQYYVEVLPSDFAVTFSCPVERVE